MKRILLIILSLIAVTVYLVLELAPPESFSKINFIHFHIRSLNAIGNELTVHFLMCFLLTLFVFLIIRVWKNGKLSFNSTLLVSFCIFVFAVLGEVAQSAMGLGRSFALDDIAVSTLGIVLATDLAGV